MSKDLEKMTREELIILAKNDYSLNLSKTYPRKHMITLIEAEIKSKETDLKKDEKKKKGEY
jgi:hypothetical protein